MPKPIKTYLWILLLILTFIAAILWFSKTAHSETLSPPIASESDPFVTARLSPQDGFSVALTTKTTKDLYILCSCVNWAKFLLLGTPYGESWGYAGNIKPTHYTPQVGDLILFKGHVGVVTSFDTEQVTFSESNYVRCRSGVRTLQIDDDHILGYK